MTENQTRGVEVLRTVPLEGIVFGSFCFFHPQGIPRSVLAYHKSGTTWERDFSLDALANLNEDRRLIGDPTWERVRLRFTNASGGIVKDLEEFRSTNGFLEILFERGYGVDTAQMLYCTLNLEQAPSISIDKGAIKCSIPEGGEHSALHSWYTSLRSRYSLD